VSRLPRIVFPNCPHHVTQRGNNREATFLDDSHRLFYLHLLGRYTHHYGVKVFGFCLMSNHIHLILQPPDATSLAQTINRAHSQYAQWFNRRTNRSGHLWQSRFFSAPLEGPHVYNALRYVDLNPVRAALIDNPQSWRWSSARAHCLRIPDEFGLLETPDWRDLPDWPAFLHDFDPAADAAIRKLTYKPFRQNAGTDPHAPSRPIAAATAAHAPLSSHHSWS
jgi:putative transposase